MAGRPVGYAAVVGSSSVAAIGGTVTALRLANAPWWAIAFVAILLTCVGAALTAMQLLLPQDSHDRLQWWLDLRRARAKRATVAQDRRAARTRASCHCHLEDDVTSG